MEPQDTVASTTPAASKPASDPSAHDRVIDLYSRMARLRCFDRALDTLDPERKVQPVRGGEAVIVGLTAAIESSDVVVATYHEHAFALAAGVDPRKVAAFVRQVTKGEGRAPGAGAGVYFGPEARLVGGCDYAGNRIAVATAIAMADRLRGEERVVACALRADSVRPHEFLEAVGLAIEWELPILFVCENNPLARNPNQVDFYEQARTFDLPSAEADGMDVLGFHATLTRALEQFYAVPGPWVIEALASYAPASRLPGVHTSARHDPLARLRRAATTAGIASAAEFDAVRERAEDDVLGGIIEALTEGPPQAA